MESISEADVSIWKHAREIPDEDGDTILFSSKQAVTCPIVAAQNQRRERNRSQERRLTLIFFPASSEFPENDPYMSPSLSPANLGHLINWRRNIQGEQPYLFMNSWAMTCALRIGHWGTLFENGGDHRPISTNVVTRIENYD